MIEVELGPGEVAWIEVDGHLVEVRGPEVTAGPRTPAPAGPGATATAPTPSVVQRPVAQDIPKRRVTARIAGPAGAVIEAREGDGWRRVCVAPCRAEVAAGTALRATAPAGRGPLWDMPTSRPYAVPEDGGAIDLTVKPGSRQQRAGGAGLAILSGAGVAIGLAMLRTSGSLDPPSRRSYEGAIVVGMASLTLITGVAMVVSGRTRIAPAKAPRRVALAPGGLAF